MRISHPPAFKYQIFVVALERLFDYYETYWEGGSNPKDDQFSELVSDEYDSDGDPCWQHAGDLYEEYFPNMFQDWEVVCRVLQCMATTDDPNPSWFAVYQAKIPEVLKRRIGMRGILSAFKLLYKDLRNLDNFKNHQNSFKF